MNNINYQIANQQNIQQQLPMLSITTVDEVSYYFWFINYQANIRRINLPLFSYILLYENISLFANYINNAINILNNFNYDQIRIYHSQMENAFKNWKKNNTFSYDQIKWLKNDDRACYWFWITVATYQQNFLLNNNSYSYRNLYQDLGLSLNPIGTSTRYQNIISFFEKAAIIDKQIFWNELKGEWDRIVTSYSKPLSWIKKNEEQKYWAINYLYEKIPPLKENIILTSTLENEPDLPLSFVIDTFTFTPLEKKEFLRTMNSAWNQYKVRKNKVNKKAINAYLSIDHKNKLDKIAQVQRQSIEKTIEMLIDNYYGISILTK